MLDNKNLGVLDRSLAAGHWSTLNMVIQKVLSFGTFFILAHLLMPSDFGIVSLVTLMMMIFSASQLVNMALKVWVFPEAGKVEEICKAIAQKALNTKAGNRRV